MLQTRIPRRPRFISHFPHLLPAGTTPPPADEDDAADRRTLDSGDLCGSLDSLVQRSLNRSALLNVLIMNLDLSRSTSPEHDTTSAIQAAIDRIAADGGGTLRIGPGCWPCGHLRLNHGVLLELVHGAVLDALADPSRYPEPTPDRQVDHGRSLISAEGARDSGIIGRGTIRCHGGEWWDPPLPGSRWYRFRPGSRLGPVLEFSHCKNLRIEGIRIEDSPGWTVLCWCCDQVVVRDVDIDNHLFGPNTDGIDLNGCNDALIDACRISTGDDAVVIKTSHNARPSARILVRGCRLRSHCAALKCGTEVFHSITDVVFADCLVTGSNRIFALYALDGGAIERVQVRGICGDTDTGMILSRPIHIDLRRRDDDSARSRIRDITIDGFHARTDGRVLITAEEGCQLSNLVLRDCVLAYDRIEDPAVAAPASRSTQFSNRSPAARAARAAVVVDGCDDLAIERLTLRWPAGADVPMHALWGRRLRRPVWPAELPPSMPGVQAVVVDVDVE